MNLHNINTISKYEVKLLRRSWLFRIFAVLTLLTITAFLLIEQTSLLQRYNSIWPRIGLSSLMPFMATYGYNIIQSVIVIFLAGSFLKRDKKLDTAEVIYVRPMSNADYILGKTWGIIRLFLTLQIIVLCITAFFNIAVNHSPFNAFFYFFYLITLSFPSLLFVLGLSFTIMNIVKNQAVTFIIMLGIIGTVFFYLPDTLFGVFDFLGANIPAIFSDVVGLADPVSFFWQRLTYFLAGAGMITFTISLVKRLPHRPWKIVIINTIGSILLIAGIGCGTFYVWYNYHKLHQRDQYAEIYNRYADQKQLHLLSADLFYDMKGDILQAKAEITLKNPYNELLPNLLLYLNPGFKITSLEEQGQPLPFTQEGQVVQIQKNIDPQEEIVLQLSYEGKIEEAVCYTDVPEQEYMSTKTHYLYRFGKRYAWQENKYVLFTPECLWYPVSASPSNPQNPYHLRKDFTRYTLTVIVPQGKTAISQGQPEQQENQFTFTNTIPLPGISLAIGDYEKKSLQVDSVFYEIYYFRGHDFFSEKLKNLQDTLPQVIRETKNKLEIRDKNRDYLFPRFMLVETPVSFSTYLRNWKGYTEYIQPEIVFLSERGVTFYFDIDSYKRILQNWRGKEEMLTETDIETQTLQHFIELVLCEEKLPVKERNWDELYVNPYNISPLFFHHTVFINSDQYPVADIVFNTMQNAVASEEFGWRSIISDEQRANFYLSNRSFQEALRDTKLKPEILHEILKLKSSAFYNYVTAQISTEEFNAFLKEFSFRHRFKTASFNIFLQELQEKSPIQTENFLHDWYTTVHAPAIYTGQADADQVEIEEFTKYAVRFKTYNFSETDAIITAEAIIARQRQGRGSPEDENKVRKSYIIPAKKAYEIKMILDEQPAFVIINTNISQNLPSTHRTNFAKITTTTSDTTQGIFPIDTTIFVADPNEIIVDNESPGFRTVSSNTRHKLKDMFQKKEEDKYKDFSPWLFPSQWTLTATDYCYGDIINSAVYKIKGSGANSVVWTAHIPKEGYYEVSVWNAKPNFGMWGRRGRNMPKRVQTYILRYGSEQEKVPLDMESEQAGWVSIGNFYLPEGAATITLTDKTDGQYVIADAVKFVRIEE